MATLYNNCKIQENPTKIKELLENDDVKTLKLIDNQTLKVLTYRSLDLPMKGTSLTPLQYCIFNDKVGCFDVLIDKNIDINHWNHSEAKRAIDYAIEYFCKKGYRYYYDKLMTHPDIKLDIRNLLLLIKTKKNRNFTIFSDIIDHSNFDLSEIKTKPSERTYTRSYGFKDILIDMLKLLINTNNLPFIQKIFSRIPYSDDYFDDIKDNLKPKSKSDIKEYFESLNNS